MCERGSFSSILFDIAKISGDLGLAYNKCDLSELIWLSTMALYNGSAISHRPSVRISCFGYSIINWPSNLKLWKIMVDYNRPVCDFFYFRSSDSEMRSKLKILNFL